ncbi:alpha/beta hydrolase [Sinimarinibacterium sp. CAU 1509]|uniref:alpha/beta hydrolase n=1 Tax=Sinimarinibacterium sp. CAU 1509 TaxID=2562283 RepID=UPI00146AB72E|nr:alpha/beta hydrolase [Sinimarinibacterium sp. CAU 1509]
MRSIQFQHGWGRGQRAHVNAWLPDAEPRGCVQIIHGMAEHAGRYARIGAQLAEAGFAVYAQDLPGHGRSIDRDDTLGHIAEWDGWPITLSAINGVRGHIEKEHPGRPLFMLGHSRGSFLLQDYVVEHGHGLAGVIFSAGCADLGPLRAVGLGLLRLEALWAGRAHRSALAEALSFKSFNREFKPNRTGFDWLSRDTEEVDRYISDPLCGFRCSVAMWIDLLSAAGHLRDPQRLARIPKTLPILAINGTDDPACRGAQGARSLERNYREAGLSDVTLKLYAQGRHELLNDLCRDEVSADLCAWLEAQLPPSAAPQPA